MPRNLTSLAGLTEQQRNELDPIACFIKETRALKRDAAANGNTTLATYCDNVLDFITYARADSDRLNFLEENPQYLNIKADDIRAFIDRLIEKQESTK